MAIDFSSNVSVKAGSIDPALTSSANELILPFVPAFRVGNGTLDTTSGTVSWGTVYFNNTSSYSSGQFIIPVTGYYRVMFWKGTGVTAGEYRLAIYRNGSGNAPITIETTITSVGGRTCLVDLVDLFTAGDILTARIISGPSATGNDSGVYSGFSAHLI